MNFQLNDDNVTTCVNYLKSLNYYVSEDVPPSATPGHNSLCDGLIGVYSFRWHIFGMLVILISSFIGVLLPLITEHVPWLKNNPYVFAFSKTMATGVLLSVSTIHLINEGILMFRAPCVGGWVASYQAYAFLFALIAALLMQALDIELVAITERWVERKQSKRSDNVIVVNAQDDAPPRLLFDEILASCAKNSLAKKDSNQDALDLSSTEHFSARENTCVHACSDGSHGHQHFFEMPQDMGMMRKVISAICMEFGVALHSIFVGIAVGLTTDDELSPLLVALFFHQMFEGMSLGSRLIDAQFRGLLEIILASIFTLSAPLGMSLSIIAVGVSRDSMSGSTFVSTMAVLDSFCGGILLYLAFNLLLFDFPADLRKFCGDEMPGRVKRKVGLFLGLWFGMGLMAFVGKWL